MPGEEETQSMLAADMREEASVRAQGGQGEGGGGLEGRRWLRAPLCDKTTRPAHFFALTV